MSKHAAYMSQYYKNNPEYREKCKEKSKKVYHHQKNVGIKYILSDEQKALKKERDKIYKEKNKEALKIKKKQYYQSDDGKIKQRAAKQRQRARKNGHKTSIQDIRALVNNAKDICYWCKNKLNGIYHIDHYVPLAKGGTNEISNLVVSCPKCNLEKNAKDPFIFAISKGSLF